MNEAHVRGAAPARPLQIFLVAGEKSGDELGAGLMRAISLQSRGEARFSGVGGEAMKAAGLASLFAMTDIAVMGFLPVIARLPTLLRRIRQTAAAIVAARPDVLVIIDSPDFTHRVARRVRARVRSLPIVDYVSPTVWAWRPGRAKAMRAFIDELLALLPFEPEAHRRLGGPACFYVGHPLIERLAELRASDAEAVAREAQTPSVVVLPGSRHSEIDRLMPVFGETIARIAEEFGEIDFVLPAVAHVEAAIRAHVQRWAVQPRIVSGEAAKYGAFRTARAALAASGTVTLELALSHVPMVVGYAVSAVEAVLIRRLATAHSVVLANLVLGENIVPEFLQEACVADRLAPALAAVLRAGEARDAQLRAFSRLDQLMRLPEGETPSSLAAKRVLAIARGKPAD